MSETSTSTDIVEVGKEPEKPKGKRLLFCVEYLKDGNATKAYGRAGYSQRCAHSAGPRMLENVVVKNYIAWLRSKQVKRITLDADWMLKRLGDEAQADAADLFNADGSYKPIHEWPKIWRQGLVAGIETSTTTDKKGKKTTEITKVRLVNRQKQLEMIGRHIDVQAFQDSHLHRMEHDFKNMTDQQMSDAILDAAKAAPKEIVNGAVIDADFEIIED